MTTWNAVTRDDLLAWADGGASGSLPELVRRLIYETAGDRVQSIDFPGGTGVSAGGFDGFAVATAATPFLPAGRSVWELSIEQGSQGKAEEDIGKRAEVPDGSPSSEATYVQVICRQWTKAGQFARDQTAKGTWAEVRGYNVDRLTTWLEQAPATKVWFLEQVSRPTMGLHSASDWWNRWSTATEPVVSPDLLLSREVADLAAALRRPGLTTVGGALGSDEITACTIATAVEANNDVLPRVVVVDDRLAFSRLLKEGTPLVLIPSDPSFADEVDADTKHTVIVPVPQTDRSDVGLRALDSDKVAEVLRSMEVDNPYDLAALARRSLVSFRRRLARRPELMRPEWSMQAPPRAVRAALLLTGWHDKNDADRAVIEQLGGSDYDSLREELIPLTQGADPLLAVTNGYWHVVSPVDAWLLLGRYLLTDDLERFVDLAEHVLGERDPRYDLPADDRWRARLGDKVLTHSHTLRKGMASGAALLGTNAELVVAATGADGQLWATRLVRPLLEAANADGTGERWASLADHLGLLMEAAPDEVLDAFDLGVAGSDPVLRTIFQDRETGGSFFGTSSPHPPFQWALETAAWSADYLSRASDVLGALATLDPGGRWANRPDSSLAGIFCPWHPDTAASPEQRLAVIDRLRKRWPDVLWTVLLSMLPTNHQIHHPSSAPDFRDWKPAFRGVPRVEYFEHVNAIVERLIKDAEASKDRWISLLKAAQQLPSDMRAQVLQGFTTLDFGIFGPEDRRALWEELRKEISHHREYADADWALTEEELAPLEAAATLVAPTSPSDAHQWLFANDWIELGDVRRRDDFAAYDEEVASRRAAAIQEVFDEGGIDAVESFAASTQPWIVGVALARADEDQHIPTMVGWLDADEDETRRTIALNYLFRRARVAGFTWAVELLDGTPTLSPTTQAHLLLMTDDFEAALDEAKRRGPDVLTAYWQNFNYAGRGADFRGVLTAARGMLGVGRSAHALDMLGLYARDEVSLEFAEVIATGIEELLKTGSAEDFQVLQTWDYERLFAALDAFAKDLGVNRVIGLQWNLFPVLGYDPPTTTLHHYLAENPEFFVQMVTILYKPKSEETREAHQSASQEVLQRAYHLLDSWKTIPGLKPDKTLDMDFLRQWIAEATEQLTAADRLDVGRSEIGHILSYAPAEGDGWPTEAVADLLEDLASDEIDHGIEIKIHNRRGVTSRGLTDGGTQERNLAEDFHRRALRFRDSHPRVARLLTKLARSYEHEAVQNDGEAERRRRGLD